MSPYPGIRQTAIECLKLLSDKDNAGLGMFAPLVKHVLQCEVEIESDQEYLKQVKYHKEHGSERNIHVHV